VGLHSILQAWFRQLRKSEFKEEKKTGWKKLQTAVGFPFFFV